MRSFATETGQIAYQVIEADEAPAGGGSPATVTLLHNFMSSGRIAWGGIIPTLTKRFRVLLPDLPGHGQSTGHPHRFHHWAMARQIAALMHAEGAESGHLAGCSSGGMIAQLLVHHRMVSPATLTLVSSTYSTNTATTGVGKALLPANFQAGDLWLDATARLHDPYQGVGYFDSTLLPGFKALRPGDAIDLPLTALEAFRLPVCLIHGDRDEFFPVQIVREMAEYLPNASVHLVPNQTHALIFRRPWQVAELMDAFLAQVAPALNAG